MDTKKAHRNAQTWVDSDPENIRDDINRLGFEAALDYNLDLIGEVVATAEENRKYDTTRTALDNAFGQLMRGE